MWQIGRKLVKHTLRKWNQNGEKISWVTLGLPSQMHSFLLLSSKTGLDLENNWPEDCSRGTLDFEQRRQLISRKLRGRTAYIEFPNFPICSDVDIIWKVHIWPNIDFFLELEGGIKFLLKWLKNSTFFKSFLSLLQRKGSTKKSDHMIYLPHISTVCYLDKSL